MVFSKLLLLEQARRPRVEKIIARAQRFSQDKKPAGPLVNWLRTKAMAVFFTLFGERMMDEAYGYKIEWNTAELELKTASAPLAASKGR